MKYLLAVSITIFFLAAHAQIPYVVCSASSIDQADGVTIQWSVGETIIADLTNSEIAIQSGFQNIQVADDTTTSVTEAFGAVYPTIEFTVYPNPSEDYFYIEGQYAKPMTLEVFDSDGRLVERALRYSTGDRISLTSVPDGLYVLRLSNAEMIIGTYKWLKKTF